MNEKRVEAVIDLQKIADNYQAIRSRMKPETKVIAVVKADAYGHGAAAVCHRLSMLGADLFAVACLDEALILRECGVRGDILILGVTPAEQTDALISDNLIQTVSSVDYASELAKHAGNESVRVHIMVDTGMSRLGFYCHTQDDVQPCADGIEQIHALTGIHAEGLLTHFACADDPACGMTKRQYASFTAVIDACERRGIRLGLRHCCNSPAIVNYPEMQLDAVRAGLLLYGLNPNPPSLPLPKEIRPAMELLSRVAHVSHIKKGDTVSYGAAFCAEKAMDTAVISVGYADGLLRCLSGKMCVLIHGKPAPILGKICMDLCIADVTGIDCAAGDIAEVFGNGQSVDVLADLAGTINYEMICSVRNRVPRRYI